MALINNRDYWQFKGARINHTFSQCMRQILSKVGYPNIEQYFCMFIYKIQSAKTPRCINGDTVLSFS